MEPDLIFKALSDETRRKLLDLLFLKQGRSLTELEKHIPMTRFGVMKHLKVLKDAGLVATRKDGRETLHYLNAVPIQMVYDRWVSKYSKGWARSLTELKYDLEAQDPEAIRMAEAAQAQETKHVFEVYIKTTPEKLWQALTDGALTRQYYFGTSVTSDWKAGSEYKYLTSEDASMVDGKVIESDPPKILVTTFNPRWSPDGEVDYPESRVTFEITEMGDACRLSLVHDRLTAGHPLTKEFHSGWSQILSGLKTLLETGKPLTVSAPKAE